METGAWVDVGVSRGLDRQRSQADSLKLLVTFIVAVSATMVGTAFQVRWSSGVGAVDRWALALTGAAVAAAILVFVFDGLEEVNLNKVLAEAKLAGDDDAGTVQRLRLEASEIYAKNEEILSWMRSVTVAQGLIAVISGVLAGVSLWGGHG